MKHNPFFMVGSILVVIIVVLVVTAPLFIQFDPVKNSLADKFIAPEWLSKGTGGHVLGTDEMGRDVFTRLLVGGKYSLTIATSVVILQILLGSILGIIAGYAGGVLDTIIMRICDIVLSIPNLILAIAIMAIMGVNIGNLIGVLTFSGWVGCCRVTRNNVKVIKKQEFVYASQALGAGGFHIMLNFILSSFMI